MNEAVIIGAGPAGLTAAYELVTRAGIRPTVIEMEDCLGGISRTVDYKGNRIDIGGHRFFSKSDRVMRWWLGMMPLQKLPAGQRAFFCGGQEEEASNDEQGADPETADNVMLLRHRKSRIYYRRKFFDYPLSLSAQTLMNLGLIATGRIALSYFRSCLLPIRNEANLEEFFINRFGRELYKTFFKSYTEKVWGVSCSEISAAWGAQRIKGLSVWRAIAHALKKPFRRKMDISQKGSETSLIEAFLYPKFGPGQMWETVADRIVEHGGRIVKGVKADKIITRDNSVIAIEGVDRKSGQRERFEGDYFFSTAPIRELVRGLDSPVPEDLKAISEGLVYRDFLTVGLLLERIGQPGEDDLTDNWVYIQEPDVLVGRLQIFKNWSPYMVADPSRTWVGLEYFCSEGDEIWSMDDSSLIRLGVDELNRLNL
ncbi:MAG: NAD(P)/FAD-dependent oxidoreductase, partial [Planctomycetota bacterium]